MQDDQFCRLVHSDIGGEPDVYTCESYPTECSGMATCACLEMHVVFDACTEDMPGQVTIEHYGG